MIQKPMTDTRLKDLYFNEGIQYIPKLLELADRNRLSSTYGCFDRGFWHYRCSDFPSGMYQESVLPLALVFSLKHPANPYYGNARIQETVMAGIDFARHSSHPDGSCDDYFPFERAAGATAFSLYACTEALLVTKSDAAGFLDFFKRRANYLATEGIKESGVLSNHKALIVLGLYNVFLLTNDPAFKEKAEACLAKLLALQTEEGWFPEYEGCDPGYLTFTIDFLAKYYQKSSDPAVVEPLCRAIEFASYFMHPDGSFGGEYGSRNTFHFMPHGFEIMGGLSPWAVPTADAFLLSLQKKTRSCIDDDRIFIHYTYNFLQAHGDFFEPREVRSKDGGRVLKKFFEQAGLYVVSDDKNYAVISTRKGGTAKYFRNGTLKFSDCGFVGATDKRQKFISQVVADWKHEVRGDTLVIEGGCYEHRDLVFKPGSFLLFRAFLVLIARFLPANFVRTLLQKKAITKRLKRVPVSIRTEIPLRSLDKVKYSIRLTDDSVRVEDLWIGSDPTFIYIATSQPFQQGNLLPWVSLGPVLRELNEKREVHFEHTFP